MASDRSTRKRRFEAIAAVSTKDFRACLNHLGVVLPLPEVVVPKGRHLEVGRCNHLQPPPTMVLPVGNSAGRYLGAAQPPSKVVAPVAAL